MRKLFLVLLVLWLSCLSVAAAERRTPVVNAVAKARDAVVNIRTEQIVERRNRPFFGFGDSIFDQFFQDLLPSRRYKTQSLGSGVIIDAAGHILTNAHVVDKASKIFIALPDSQQELQAELIGQDLRIDLAVLKIVKKQDYPFLPPASSSDLLLGETVIAIGNPLGLGHSITTGIVSSLQRRIQVGRQQSSIFIQTDALINPGNSGGPLININGELIGINTAIAQQAQGIGFSIPIDTAKRVLSDLIEYGRVRPGFFGAAVSPVSETFARSYGSGGVLVEQVFADSPAARAGFRVADVVLAIDGLPVASPEQFYSLMQTYTPGDRIELSLLRGARTLTKQVDLAALPPGYALTYTRRVFGFTLRRGRQGPIVDQVVRGSAADQVGLEAGDLVAKVTGIEVATLADYSRVIEQRIGHTPLTFTIVRDNFAYRIKLP
jgi:serine protease Do